MREICTFGSVRGGGGNIPAYSAQGVVDTSNWPASSLTITVSGSRPWWSTLPDSGLGGQPTAVAPVIPSAVEMGLPGVLVGKFPAVVASALDQDAGASCSCR